MQIDLNVLATVGECTSFSFFFFFMLRGWIVTRSRLLLRYAKAQHALLNLEVAQPKLIPSDSFFWFSPFSSPQHAVIQPGLARGVWLPAGGEWTQLYPVCGGGQQCPPGRVAGWGPSPGDRRSQCVNPGSTSRDRHCPDSEEHPPQYRSSVPHSAGLKDSLCPKPFNSSSYNLNFPLLSFLCVQHVLMLD